MSRPPASPGLRVVYYDHQAGGDQAGFRSGAADRVVTGRDGVAEAVSGVRIPPNSLHALLGHGVADRLDRLPLVYGRVAAGTEAVLRPTAFSEASRILYEADRKTYGAIHEFVTHEEAGPDPVQYRIVVDNREYQRTLARLQYLLTLAGREGYGVRLRL
ncbi:MAG: hypothetical protein ACQGVC_26160 [Myxococcota bacterium]